MSLGEFDIIRRFFATRASRSDVQLGIGDDAAVLNPRTDRKLVLAMDTIGEGVHFLKNTSGYDVGFRALAVNLSDLAAMGAEPSWMSLSLSLPTANAAWLEDFARGLFDLADRYDVQLIGGDTVRGPMVITVQVGGWVECDRWLTRSGAQPGDNVYVTGTLGDASAGLRTLRDRINSTEASFLQQRFLRPEPRIAAGRALRTIASAAMDVSDGLLADAAKLCEASQYGITVDVDALPLSRELRASFDEGDRIAHALSGGDDYELLFTVSVDREQQLASGSVAGVPVTRIGVIESAPGLRCQRGGQPYSPRSTGYDHFAHN
jgi:thiamine-monophosphate kinase